MGKLQLTHVKKRDGRLVPFEPAKLARSLHEAATTCEVQQSFFARELADAIAQHLALMPEGGVPTTDAIAASAEKVMGDLNYQEVADAYRAYRQRMHHLSLEAAGNVVPASDFAATREQVEAIWRAAMEAAPL